MTDIIATYRLQFRPEFGFADAAAIVPYLAALGISHIYASPIFRARPGSPHGYDGVDPNRLNPELGTPGDWDALVRRRQNVGMGWLQDIVPNHMAFHPANGMLADVCENGNTSRYRTFFDIDWHHPARDLQGKIMAPFLGSRFRECLQNGDIRIAFDADGFAVRVYDDMRFPLAIESYRWILEQGETTAQAALGKDDPGRSRLNGALEALGRLALLEEPDERHRQARAVRDALWDLALHNAGFRRHIDTCLARLNGDPGNPQSLHGLEELLSRQHFRLCWWQRANAEINYRRFFDINELIALRQEDPGVFAHTHALVAALTVEGRVDGVRIDHVDGLADPRGYLRALRRRLGDDAHILVEKILAPEEALPAGWPVQGTTGYDFAYWVNALFVHREHEARFTEIYRAYSGRQKSFADEVQQAKREILATRLAGDLANLARRVSAVAGEDRSAEDLPETHIAEALVEMLVRFPVYRTYLGAAAARKFDRDTVAAVAAQAAEQHPRLTAASTYIRSLLLTEEEEVRSAPPDGSGGKLAVVGAFQQLSSALMAKGCEDTAFYRYHRLVSLNDVGSEPGQFGCRRSQFHRFIRKRAAAWPRAMNSTATHDSKRGEDVRARLNVLSEIPDAWRQRVHRWHDLTRNFRTRIAGGMAPDRNTVYLLFQTLLGAWPPGEEEIAPFEGRVQDYMRKAIREAGEATSWIAPQEDCEAALERFVAAVLEPSPDNLFLADFVPFCRRIAFYGRFNALSQCLIKIAAPGVPDFYQGTELMQLALVDPDNRRPVAYGVHEQALKTIDSRRIDDAALASDLIATAEDGRIKLLLVTRALDARRRYQDLFGAGRYLPLETSGTFEAHVVAFAREAGGRWALAVAPRFLTSLVEEGRPPLGPEVWQDTMVHLPPEAPLHWRNAFTGIACRSEGGIRAGDVLSHFPVALLISEEIP